ncbi:DUF2207 domain-containing protein [Companilactobacillus sp.]|uniref:DUF2207 domain-containing protein n=1 Tax=Companilactobacillus sp. TaxID=2767905 RepID=UPI00262DD90B|nr:DUF2207 domain-containing protein [Companilactobacillus sp.]
MRKNNFLFAIIILFATFTFFLNHNESQASSYSIDQYQTFVTVNSNGSADVRQLIKYHVSGSKKNVAFSQSLKKGSDPSLTSIQLFDGKNEVPLRYETSGDNTYDSVTGDHLLAANIRHTITNNSATAIYNYHVKKFVTNYSDTAEIYWRVVGNDWEKKISHVKVTYQFPKKTLKSVNMWVSGPSVYSLNKNEKAGQMSVYISKLTNHQPLDNRLIFPVSWVPQNKNIVHQNKRQNILNQQHKIAQGIIFKKIIFWMIAAAFIIVTAIVYRNRFKHLNYDKFDTDYQLSDLQNWFDIPDVSPSMAKIILTKNETADLSSFIGELMIQVKRNHLGLKQLSDTYEISLIKKPDDEFYEFLVTRVGDGKSVTTKQIAEYQGLDLWYEFQKWRRRAAIGRSKYIDEKNDHVKSMLASLALMTTTFAAIQFILVPFLAPSYLIATGIICGLVIILSWFIFYRINRKITVYTSLGQREAAEIKGFKHVLKSISSLNSAKIGDLTLWEDVLPYAVAFDLSLKVLEDLRINFDASQLTDSPLSIYYDTNPALGYGFMISLADAFYSNDFINLGGSSNDISSMGVPTGGLGDSSGIGGGSNGGLS